MQPLIPFLGSLDGVGIVITCALIACFFLVSLSVARATFFSRRLPQGPHLALRTTLAAIAGGTFLATATIFSGILGIQLESIFCLLRGGMECGAIWWALFGYFFAAPILALIGAGIITTIAVARWRWRYTPTTLRPRLEKTALWAALVLSCVSLAGIFTLFPYAQDHAKQRARTQWDEEQQHRVALTTTLMERAESPTRFVCTSGDAVLEAKGSIITITHATNTTITGPRGYPIPYTSLIDAEIGTIENNRLVPVMQGEDISSWFWQRFGRCVNGNGMWLESVFSR